MASRVKRWLHLLWAAMLLAGCGNGDAPAGHTPPSVARREDPAAYLYPDDPDADIPPMVDQLQQYPWVNEVYLKLGDISFDSGSAEFLLKDNASTGDAQGYWTGVYYQALTTRYPGAQVPRFAGLINGPSAGPPDPYSAYTQSLALQINGAVATAYAGTFPTGPPWFSGISLDTEPFLDHGEATLGAAALQFYKTLIANANSNGKYAAVYIDPKYVTTQSIGNVVTIVTSTAPGSGADSYNYILIPVYAYDPCLDGPCNPPCDELGLPTIQQACALLQQNGVPFKLIFRNTDTNLKDRLNDLTSIRNLPQCKGGAIFQFLPCDRWEQGCYGSSCPPSVVESDMPLIQEFLDP